MRVWIWILVAGAAIGCEGKQKPGAGGGAGSQVTALAPAEAAVASAAAALEMDAAMSADAALTDPKTLDYAHILDWETIGPLKIGLDQKTVMTLLGEPQDQTDIVKQGATGKYVSDWTWSGKAVELRMSGTKESGPFRVSSIEIYVPSEYSTTRGATIGTSASELPSMYVRNVDKGNDEPNQYLVGSLHGGLMFTLKDGRVISIFLGAMEL